MCDERSVRLVMAPSLSATIYYLSTKKPRGKKKRATKKRSTTSLNNAQMYKLRSKRKMTNIAGAPARHSCIVAEVRRAQASVATGEASLAIYSWFPELKRRTMWFTTGPQTRHALRKSLTRTSALDSWGKIGNSGAFPLLIICVGRTLFAKNEKRE